MIHVTLDTNVVVSALIKPGSIPEFVFQLVLNHLDIRSLRSVSVGDGQLPLAIW
jgi:predicted nucleic acid-binding protein